WKDWATEVALEPLAVEHTVACLQCGYAGTLDLYALVRGVLTVLDWKSGKAIYPEAFLQNVAYRHAAARLGLPAEQGLIVRLPKLLDDPAWEVMPVPEELQIEDVQAALALWGGRREGGGQPRDPGRAGPGCGWSRTPPAAPPAPAPIAASRSHEKPP